MEEHLTRLQTPEGVGGYICCGNYFYPMASESPLAGATILAKNALFGDFKRYLQPNVFFSLNLVKFDNI